MRAVGKGQGVSYTPMTEAKEKERARFLLRAKPGTKLHVIHGVKAGRDAIFKSADHDNPWLLNVTIDNIARVVRFDYVVIA